MSHESRLGHACVETLTTHRSGSVRRGGQCHRMPGHWAELRDHTQHRAGVSLWQRQSGLSVV